MKRGRVLPWRLKEDEYLRQNYATMDSRSIAFYLRRTQQGVWRRANRLGLSKPNGSRFQTGNQIGALRRFAVGNTPATKGQRTKLRIWERAVALFDDHKELTQTEIAQLLDVPIGSISGSLVQRPDGLMHIDRWMLIGKHYHAIYVGGPGDDAEKPNKSAQLDAVRADMERQSATPDPIPQPRSWLWGIPQATDYKQAAQAA